MFHIDGVITDSILFLIAIVLESQKSEPVTGTRARAVNAALCRADQPFEVTRATSKSAY